MRVKFISNSQLEDAANEIEACLNLLNFEPFTIVECDNGYMCFESEDDFNTWESQY